MKAVHLIRWFNYVIDCKFITDYKLTGLTSSLIMKMFTLELFFLILGYSVLIRFSMNDTAVNCDDFQACQKISWYGNLAKL
ncbi:hypothetical protein TUM4433_39780 [Shewanella schlegeliana]|nr:hypothetical protein TUM4433_39780 [Shewanella schlegeliana]